MEPNVVYVENKKVPLWHRRLQRRVILPLSISIVLISLGSVGGVYFYRRYHSHQLVVNFKNAVNTSQAALNDNNYNKAIRTLQSVAGDAQSPAQDETLYTNLATASANEGNYNQAITYLLKLNQLVPSTTQPDAYMLAMYYQDEGDKVNAIKYYKVAVTYAQAHPVASGTGASFNFLGVNSEASYYQGQIDALEGQ